MSSNALDWTSDIGIAAPGHWGADLRRGDVLVSLADGAIASVCLRGQEIVQRVYVGVRDRDWNTLVGLTTSYRIDDSRAEFTVAYGERGIALEVHWTVEIDGDGAVRIVTKYRPHNAFSAGKVGLCVLHDSRTHAGAEYRSSGGGSSYTGRFPQLIEPQLFEGGNVTALSPPFDRLTVALPEGASVDFAFEGDLFEIQDHRNWADLSFKTYGTPQALGWLHDFENEFTQSLTITGSVPVAAVATDVVQVSSDSQLRSPVALGTTMTSGTPDAALLAALGPRHLAIEVESGGALPEEALSAASALGVPLEITVVGHAGDVENVVRSTQHRVVERGLAVTRLLIEQVDEGGTAREVVDATLFNDARQAWADGPGVVAYGTRSHFCALNRSESVGAIDTIMFGLTTQLHSFDSHIVLLGTLALKDIAATCRQRHGTNARLSAAPVELIFADGPCPTGTAGLWGFPPEIDVRLFGLFGATWLVSLLAQLTAAGFHSATVLDAVGSRGLVLGRDPDPGLPLPHDAIVAPAFHVFSTYAQAESVFDCSVSAPERVAAVGIESGGTRKLLLANLTGQPAHVNHQGGPGALLWMLDETTARAAVVNPMRFRDQTRADIWGRAGLTLAPYASALIELGSPS